MRRLSAPGKKGAVEAWWPSWRDCTWSWQKSPTCPTRNVSSMGARAMETALAQSFVQIGKTFGSVLLTNHSFKQTWQLSQVSISRLKEVVRSMRVVTTLVHQTRQHKTKDEKETWRMSVADKKLAYGAKNRIAVGGKGDEPDHQKGALSAIVLLCTPARHPKEIPCWGVRRKDADIELVAFHALPTEAVSWLQSCNEFWE